MLRRLEKRVLVDLPTEEARQAMFQQFLPPTVIREANGLVLFSDLDYVRLSQVWSSLTLPFRELSFGSLSSAQKDIPVQISN